MGNTDSHSSFVPAPKSSSTLRFSSRREEAPSARGWWRSNQGGGSRSRGRSHPNQHAAAAPPCTSWHYEHAPKPTSPQRLVRGSPFGLVEDGGEQSPVESGGSPKVLLGRDGNMRVEFTNTRGVPVEPQGPPSLPAPVTAEPSLRTSNGSSLSSDSSWYDSPWGAAGELADNVFAANRFTEEAAAASTTSREYITVFSAQVDLSAGSSSSADNADLAVLAAGYNTCSSGRTEDSGIGDSVIIQADLTDFGPASPDGVHHSALPSFPTDTTSRPTPGSSALLLPLDDVIQEKEESGGGVAKQRYSSVTLPSRKDFLKSRIRRISDWTGSLSRKKRRIQETNDSQTTDVCIDRPDCTTMWASNPLLTRNQNQFPALHCGSSNSLTQNQNQNQSSEVQRRIVYESFMQELQTVCSSTAEQTEPSEEEEDDEEDEEEEEEMEEDEEVGGGQRLDLMEEEQGAVRRAGWLSFKALIGVSRDRKLELVARRRWRQYWVTLRGCSLLFYQSYGGGAAEPQLPPRFLLPAADGLVQAAPEHPRREHVFCLSNAHGDVYLLQATNQTDLENWVTALHSASASLLARRQGKEDTLRLLRCRCRSLLRSIDMDGKMKKMAELQLSVIKEPRSRKAVESQIQQWDQNLEKLNLDLFRLRCYLSSLQGGELPNPKSLLAVASRPSKCMLGRLGVFSVSSFHALVCSRDEATCRRGGAAPSSLRVLDGLKRRCRDATLSKLQRKEQTEAAPPAGRPAALQVWDELQPPGVFTLNICRLDAAKDFGFTVTGHVDGDGKSLVYVSEVDLLGQSAREVVHNIVVLLCPQSVERVHDLYQTFPEGRAAEGDLPRNPYGRDAALQPPSPAHLSVCERLRKVIQELVDTEKSYVKDLVRLFEVYLSPLQKENFLSKEEMEALFGSLPEMLDFQRVFLQTLEERIASCPDFGHLETPGEFKHLLFSLGGSFLYYADHFKHYSGFCANHLKVQKVLERAKTDGAFKFFLETRNPTNQHSSSLESYLIKPVQRVLKYPLLLRELVSLTEAESPEHTHLTEALRAMEKVATHINEMQKIYEDFGCVFDQLTAEHSSPDRQVTEISMAEFLVHSSVVWLNPLPALRRLRKSPELTLFVFRRAVVLVYRESGKLKKRMAASRSADLDPFRFRWLIPVSAVQVRPAGVTGSEDQCVWELVHSRSEVEGRPETVFQLCSSGLETKASVLRALRSLLRDRAPAGSVRRTRPAAAERSSSWRRRQQRRTPPRRGEETCSEPLLPSRAAADLAGKRTRLRSLTGELEAQLQRLNFTEQEAEHRRSQEQRRSSSLRRCPGGEVPDLGGFMERDFSVQSMTSMINEDCFYDPTLGRQTC
ncbi:rho guanine nucleotide exchange factor TIAM2-like [Pungitius pungitius]|uniref:rho guanine nucleotide exchange factor TIAM2-like n=1 Tax=Pungitius pungitius TaxID=134920 RepID=UPI002E0DB705